MREYLAKQAKELDQFERNQTKLLNENKKLKSDLQAKTTLNDENETKVFSLTEEREKLKTENDDIKQ